MRITAVDHYQDLFEVRDLLPQEIVDDVLTTDWLSMPWQRQQGQEQWLRRRIHDHALPWLDKWADAMQTLWPHLAQALGQKISKYYGTAWWLDEPGFTCAMHTDGEMPGAMQLTWIGQDPELGTAFYHYKNTKSLRHQFPMHPNSGYIMLNSPGTNGARHLQWHAMLTPVPQGTFRLCSYTWLSKYQNDC